MEVEATDGQIQLPEELRERYGERFRLVERGDHLLLLPVSDDPLKSLREEFADVDGSMLELRADARESVGDDR